MGTKGFNNICCVWAITLSVLLSATGSVHAITGSGTESAPYLITSVADLQQFANPANQSIYWAAGVHTRLETDPNLVGESLDPIGNYSNLYNGVFDGSGHVISNLTMAMPDSSSVGLFGYVGPDGKVKKLGLENVDIYGYGDVGTLVGRNYGTITNTYATGLVTVTEDGRSGGLVGYNGTGTITNCYSTGSVTGSGDDVLAGGLVGYNDSGAITNCYSTGSVTAYGIYYCDAGGLVGANGDVGTITNCYSTGSATTTGTGFGFAGGLIVYNHGMVTNCFWNIDSSGLVFSEGGIGLTTEQMKDPSHYSFNCWAGTDWTISEDDFPHLVWENTGGEYIPEPVITMSGQGTSDNPLQISTLEELIRITKGSFFWDKHYRLMADMNVVGESLGLIGYDYSNSFNGVFDGSGHVISNLTIAMPDSESAGLFGCVGPDGNVENLGLENVNVEGKDYVGCMVGFNRGTVTNSYASGSVITNVYRGHAGGLVGYNNGAVSNSYATGSFTATGRDSHTGGLVGYNWRTGTVSNSYASGLVSTPGQTGKAGGLIGRNDGTIMNSYATASVTATGQFGKAGGLVGYFFDGAITNSFSQPSHKFVDSALQPDLLLQKPLFHQAFPRPQFAIIIGGHQFGGLEANTGEL